MTSTLQCLVLLLVWMALTLIVFAVVRWAVAWLSEWMGRKR